MKIYELLISKFEAHQVETEDFLKIIDIAAELMNINQ